MLIVSNYCNLLTAYKSNNPSQATIDTKRTIFGTISFSYYLLLKWRKYNQNEKWEETEKEIHTHISIKIYTYIHIYIGIITFDCFLKYWLGPLKSESRIKNKEILNYLFMTIYISLTILFCNFKIFRKFVFWDSVQSMYFWVESFYFIMWDYIDLFFKTNLAFLV